MAISARGKTTFFVTILGSIASLAMSIGFIYLTLPTTAGLMLAAFASAAAAYLGSIILYNVFILQNKEKSNSSELGERGIEKIIQPLTPSEMKKNKAKAYLFALITTGCILMVAATNAITTYQSGMLLGDSLSYDPLIVSIASIAFASILGLGVLLAGYDQTYKFFYLIKGENPENQYQSDDLPHQSLCQVSSKGSLEQPSSQLLDSKLEHHSTTKTDSSIKEEKKSAKQEDLPLSQNGNLEQPSSQLLDSKLEHHSTTKTDSSIKEEKKSAKQEDLPLSQNGNLQITIATETSIGSNNFFKSNQDLERELHKKNKAREEENKPQQGRRYSSPAVVLRDH